MTRTESTKQRTLPSNQQKTTTYFISRQSFHNNAQKEMHGAKTFNSGDSPVVTHLTTSPPVRCLNRAERTGSLVVSWPLTTNILNSTVSGNGSAGISQEARVDLH
jgi:hypothetical protein